MFKAPRNPYATGGSTKRLYESGHVQFNTVVDEDIVIKNMRQHRETTNRNDSATKRFKADSLRDEDCRSVYSQEPLYVSMTDNSANSFNPLAGSALSKQSMCLVNSSVNHLQCKLEGLTSGPAPFSAFDPKGINPEEVEVCQNLFLRAAARPTFVGFASGVFEANTAKNTKQANLAANCAGLMTVQCAEQHGMKLGEPVCVTLPDIDWENKQKGIPKDKMTLVLKKADTEIKEFYKHVGGMCKSAGTKFKNEMAKDSDFWYHSYMARPLNIGQCRSGCHQQGQMMDIKMDMATLSFADMLGHYNHIMELAK